MRQVAGAAGGDEPDPEVARRAEADVLDHRADLNIGPIPSSRSSIRTMGATFWKLPVEKISSASRNAS